MSSAPTRSTSQVPQTTGDTQYNVRDAALRGASSAFSRPAVKPKPQPNTYTGGGNGALLAATKVGTGTPQNTLRNGSAVPLSRDRTGGSSNVKLDRSPIRLATKSSSSSTLGVPDDNAPDRTPSPSNIAAKLAAARYSPMKLSPQITSVSEHNLNEPDILPPVGSVSNVLARLDSRPSSQQPLRRMGSVGSQLFTKTIRGPVEGHTYSAATPSTTALVKMSEQDFPSASIKSSAEAPPPMKSPKPQRMIELNIPAEPRVDVQVKKTRIQSPPPVKAKPTPIPKPRSLSMDGSKDDQDITATRKNLPDVVPRKQKPVQLKAVSPTSYRPKTPPQTTALRAGSSPDGGRRSTSIQRRFSTSISIDSNDNPSSPSSFVSAREEPEQREEKPKPALPPPRRSAKAKSEVASTTKQPKSVPIPPRTRNPNGTRSPIYNIPEKLGSPERRPVDGLQPTRSSDILYHSNYQRESAKQLTQHLTGESLSSAIVGAALASSRNPSPGRTSSPPPLPSRKHNHHHHHSPLHHNRSPSPQKPTGKLRSTLRREPSTSSDEDESEKYKKKGTRIMGMRKKHPNKHHEGTRKRWRDSITERERKRYEGVWAANKGLFIVPSPNPLAEDPTLDVLNLVTKDIWMRSRLPEHVLEEVWDLVDGRGIGRLRREEFVVGMWLIDQMLKGRKLPLRVSDSVWGSVRGVGVKVKVRSHR